MALGQLVEPRHRFHQNTALVQQLLARLEPDGGRLNESDRAFVETVVEPLYAVGTAERDRRAAVIMLLLRGERPLGGIKEIFDGERAGSFEELVDWVKQRIWSMTGDAASEWRLDSGLILAALIITGHDVACGLPPHSS
jgi:hypothetical protein